MIHLSAFADEIAPDLAEQIAVLQREHIRFIELRSIWHTNVLDLTEAQLAALEQTLAAENMQISALCTPLGKVAIDTDFTAYFPRFEHALLLAQRLHTRYIRLLSFYPPETPPLPAPETYRAEVLRRLQAMTERAAAAGIILLHENEVRIYGDTIARNLDLLKSIDHPSLRAAFDPANYLLCQQVPYPIGYEAIKPWLEYIHVKDVDRAGTIVPAGEGEARWPELLEQLRTDGYQGFLALEPHLKDAGKQFSGPDLFSRASQALQGLLRAMHWEYL